MLQGVIFDLDGVIVDSHAAHLRAWRAFFTSVGKEVPDKELAFVLEGWKREDILRHFLGDLTPEQVRLYGERKDGLFRDSLTEMKVVPGLVDLLSDLGASRVPAAVASSGSRRRVELTLEMLKLRSYLRTVVSGDDVAKGKPDPTIFYLAAQGIGVEAANIVVCEDSVAGVTAAKSAGMKCLGIAVDGRRPILLRAGADYVVPDFTSIRVADLQRLFAIAAAG